MAASRRARCVCCLFFLIASVGRANFAARCDFNRTGTTGDKEKARLKVWGCVRATSSDEPDCSGAEKVDILIRKGEEKDTGFDVNDYAVTAKFFGKDLCVSFYKYSKRWESNRLETVEGCETFCTDNVEEFQVYHTDITCSSESCVGGDTGLKVMVTDSAVNAKQSFLLVLLAAGFTVLINKYS